MERARTQILAAVADLVESGGLSAVTMASLARRSAVAKATVYNHFRDREDVLRALVGFEGERLITHCADVPASERLQAAATWLSGSAVLAGLRRHDPGAVVGLAQRAAADPSVLDVVSHWCLPDRDLEAAMRWLVSFVVVPSGVRESGESGDSVPRREPPL